MIHQKLICISKGTSACRIKKESLESDGEAGYSPDVYESIVLHKIPS